MPISWQKKRCFCNKKNRNSLTDNVEIFLTCKWEKKQKTMFYQWSYSLWKSNLKYPNISIFLSPNICVGFYGRSGQLVPKNLEIWRETVQRSMLRFEVLCFFSTRQESETALDYIEILKYFLWNNWTVKNGGRWGIQTQIPYWPIYIGIAA